MEKIKGDLDWRLLYDKLKSQHAAFTANPGTPEAARQALQRRMKKDDPYYLKVEKAKLDLSKDEAWICKTLGEQLPELTLISVLNDKEQKVVKKYLLPGIDIGALNEDIIDIYKHIESITNP